MTIDDLFEAIAATGQLVLVAPAPAGYRVTILKPACGKVLYSQEGATIADCLTTIAKEMEIK